MLVECFVASGIGVAGDLDGTERMFAKQLFHSVRQGDEPAPVVRRQRMTVKIKAIQ
jgi:hypothetical protein